MLGKPVCFLLTTVRRLGRLFTGRSHHEDDRPVRKILFIKMIEQGATVLAYRALQTAVDRVGRENVYFWVFEENRPILDFLGVIPPENVIVIRVLPDTRSPAIVWPNTSRMMSIVTVLSPVSGSRPPPDETSLP